MLYTYFTEELIGLQDLILEKIESNEKESNRQIIPRLEKPETVFM